MSRARALWRAIGNVGALPGGLWIAAVTVYGYFLALIWSGGHQHWSRFYVPALNPPFIDLLNVTSGWECTRKGIDVLASNPCDPSGRPANYPQMWMWASHLGLGPHQNTLLGLLVAVFFFLAALALVRRASLFEGLAFGIALISPAVMLGVERGNADFIIFSLVVGALALFRARRTWVRILSHGLLFLAAALKLFPVFAWGVLARQERRWRLLSGGLLLLAFAVYALVILDDIRTIRRVLPQDVWFSFGAEVSVDAIRNALTEPADRAPGGAAGSNWPIALALVAVALSISAWIAWRRRAIARMLEGSVRGDFALDAFVAGAGIFVGSFALQQNWDYRLAFLLFTIPQLARWSRSGSSPVPLPGLTLVSVVAALWLGEAYVSTTHPPEELLNWVVFISFSAALFTLLVPALLSGRSAWFSEIRKRAKKGYEHATRASRAS